MDFFGIGAPELLVVLVLAFLLLGPGRMADMAKGVGKAMRDVRRSMDEVTHALDEEKPHKEESPTPPAPETPKDSVQRGDKKDAS